MAPRNREGVGTGEAGPTRKAEAELTATRDHDDPGAGPGKWGLVWAIALSAALGGCGGGPGWLRLESPVAFDLGDSVVFEAVSACAPAGPDRYHPARPLAIAADFVQPGEGGSRTWRLLAFAEPSDAPGRLQVIALVGQARSRRPADRQLFVGGEDVESWWYQGRLMVYGPVRSAGPVRVNFGSQQMLSACLDPEVNRYTFRKRAGQMLQQLEALRSEAAKEGGDAAEFAAPITRLMRALGKKG